MTDQTPFIDKRICLKWTELGHAVFTNEDIQCGIVIELAPVIVLTEPTTDVSIFKYVMAWNNTLAIPLGWVGLYNHSDNSCCEFCINTQDNLVAIISKRNIMAGEQLTVNYGSDWFSSRGIQKAFL